MRGRTVLIGGLMLALGALCACAVLGGGFLAYRFLPPLLAATPTPTASAIRTPTARPPVSSTSTPRPTATAAPPSPSPPTPSPLPGPTMLLRIAIPVEGVVAMAPAPDGRLALFARNGQSGFLDVRTGELREGPTAPEAVEELVFSPDGRAFALRTASEIRLWDIPGARTRFTLALEEQVRRIAFSPQGTLLLVGGADTLSGYFVETGRRAFAFDLYDAADQFVMTPDERLIFQMTERASDLEVWDARTGEWWGSLEFEPLTAIALSPDGRLLVAAENEMRPMEEGYEAPFPARIALWAITIRPEQQEVERRLAQELDLVPELEYGKFPLPLKALAFTPDGRRIIGLADWVGEGDMSGRLYVWDAASGRMIGRAVLPPRPWKMALMEEGRSVAVLIGGGFFATEVRIYELPER
ncbi:WD40 repeat domain-containing protein [Thermoflexus hugenholtzii]